MAFRVGYGQSKYAANKANRRRSQKDVSTMATNPSARATNPSTRATKPSASTGAPSTKPPMPKTTPPPMPRKPMGGSMVLPSINDPNNTFMPRYIRRANPKRAKKMDEQHPGWDRPRMPNVNTPNTNIQPELRPLKSGGTAKKPGGAKRITSMANKSSKSSEMGRPRASHRPRKGGY